MSPRTETPGSRPTTADDDVVSMYYIDIDVQVKSVLMRTARTIATELQRLVDEQVEKLNPHGRSAIYFDVVKLNGERGRRDILMSFSIEATDEEIERLVTRLTSITSGLHAVYRGILETDVTPFEIDMSPSTLVEVLALLLRLSEAPRVSDDVPSTAPTNSTEANPA